MRTIPSQLVRTVVNSRISSNSGFYFPTPEAKSNASGAPISSKSLSRASTDDCSVTSI